MVSPQSRGFNAVLKFAHHTRAIIRAQNSLPAGNSVPVRTPSPQTERAKTPQTQDTGSSVPAPFGAGCGHQYQWGWQNGKNCESDKKSHETI